ncbi:MAG TPA: CHRD domain-containing protein [Gemmatimonadaceae bacterium]|nr:CHRD domain-containing protein [Gemmatimonadaceae bacterium]
MIHRVVALGLATATIVACGSSNDGTPTTPASHIVTFTASMSPAGEFGSNLIGNPQGTGQFTATLDTVTNVFTYNVQFSGLTSNVNNGHIHGPFNLAGTANTANVILNFDPAQSGHAPDAVFTGFKAATTGSATGTITLNAATQITSTINGDSLRKLLLAGMTYANIHTTNNPGGEIRGQISIKQ